MATKWTKNAKEGFAKNSVATTCALIEEGGIRTNSGLHCALGDQSTQGRPEFVETFGINIPTSPNFSINPTVPENTNVPKNTNVPDIPKNSGGIPNFGDLPFDGKSFDELILLNGLEITPPDLSGIKSINDDMDSLMQDFNPTKAKDLYKKTINSLKDSFSNLGETFADNILKFFGIYNEKSAQDANYIKDMEILSGQFSRWFAIFISYIVVLNWWYILCYTNFTFDFRKFIWEPLKYVMAPAFNAIESINYHMVNIRMDSEPRLFGYKDWISNEDIRSLWHWRSISFPLFHFLIAGALIGLPVSNEVASILTGSGYGMVFMVAIVLSCYYWTIMMFVEEKLFEQPMYTNTFMGGLLLIAVLIGTALAVLVFVSIVCVFFFLYLMYISNLSLFIFNGFNPFSVWSSVNEIFDDLKSVYVTPDDPTTTNFEKLQKLMFRNAHSIYVLFIVFIVVLSINITECFKFSSKLLIIIGVIFNLICVSLFIPNAVKMLKEIWNLVLLMLPNNSNTDLPEPAE